MLAQVADRGAQLASFKRAIFHEPETTQLLHPSAEIEAIRCETMQLRSDADQFQEDLLSKMQGPSVDSRQGLVERLGARIETEIMLERNKEALLKRSRRLHERVSRLEGNVFAVDVSIVTLKDHLLT
ncbi:hypothetical protein LTR85_011322 [Meristemomyces frigidus]|nr:hypothetical protein LTR85_011322 [Meristemomyces frigidus]